MNVEEWMWLIWLGVFVVALVAEAITTEVVSIWFAGGAIVTLFVSFIPDVPWWVEAVVFTVVSLALLVFLRPLMKKLLKRDIIASNADAMTGKKGIITQDITPLQSGEVNVEGVIWTAISTKDGDNIPAGTNVKVLSISGNKLIVSPIK